MLDIAYMRCVPNCVLMAPRDGEEFIRMLTWAVDQTQSPAAIRYPKATVPDLPPSRDREIRPGKAEILVDGQDIVLFAYGAMVHEAWKAAPELQKFGVRPTIVNARWAKPLDVDLLAQLAEVHSTIVTLEEHSLIGGFGSAVVEALADHGIRFERILRIGVPDRFVTFGSRDELMAELGVDAAGIVRTVRALTEAGSAAGLAAEAAGRLSGQPGRTGGGIKV
jgi:1-deoxy-D-xylulose-5-phosphate synthase